MHSVYNYFNIIYYCSHSSRQLAGCRAHSRCNPSEITIFGREELNNLDNRRQTVAVSLSGKRTTWRALAINNPHWRGDLSAIAHSMLLPPSFSCSSGFLPLADFVWGDFYFYLGRERQENAKFGLLTRKSYAKLPTAQGNQLLVQIPWRKAELGDTVLRRRKKSLSAAFSPWKKHLNGHSLWKTHVKAQSLAFFSSKSCFYVGWGYSTSSTELLWPTHVVRLPGTQHLAPLCIKFHFQSVDLLTL